MTTKTTTAVVTRNESAAVSTLLFLLAVRIFLGWLLTPLRWLGSALLNFKLRGMRLW